MTNATLTAPRPALRRRLLMGAASLVPRGIVLPIVAGPLKGMRWIAGAAPGVGKGLSVVVNQAEPQQMAAAAALVPDGGVCFDIGANVGLYTLLMARRAARVYAFEPLPRNVRYLAATVAANRLTNVTIVPCAVAASVGLAAFAEGADWGRGSLGAGGTQPVGTVSVDAVVERTGSAPALLKIDVEGAEMDVLTGAAALLASHRPALLLSTHSDALRAACLQRLREIGYRRIRPLNAAAEAEASEFAIEF